MHAVHTRCLSSASLPSSRGRETSLLLLRLSDVRFILHSSGGICWRKLRLWDGGERKGGRKGGREEKEREGGKGEGGRRRRGREGGEGGRRGRERREEGKGRREGRKERKEGRMEREKVHESNALLTMYT